MQLIFAAEIARMVMRDGNMLGAEIEFGTLWWFVYAGISCFVVLFAGIMSGLTLGLMSLSLVDLEILERSGTHSEKKQAGPSNISGQTFQSICRNYIVCDFCSSIWRDSRLFVGTQ
ncbi:hypothetical protein ACH5RR_033368 [Cinchona calisaya]|uniref:CNNM transmembrane domain-containing protein n=1 Tax=Cinchona calisaya TaxID=153742 RepID=A0ABD2YMT9_9GENT